MKLDRENYGKWMLIAVTLLMWLLLLVLFKFYGYHETWELWNVPTAKDTFLDFQLIPGSAESFRQGFEPTINNPFDPAQRIFNYPAFWRLFFYTGITVKDTIWFGVSMILLFFLGVFLFPGRLSTASVIGMLLVIFSPAAMLLYERGNVDLIVFFICALIVYAESYSSNVAALIIAFGSIVKMFPFFGVTLFWKESKSKFWLLFSICLAVLVVYMVLTWGSVKASWNTTMRGDGLSYGTNVFVTRYWVAISKALTKWFTSPQADLILKYAPLLIALFLLIGIFLLALFSAQNVEFTDERNMAAFRMGAAIYVGTFLLGNNFDYRLAFLIFVMPQLVEWTRLSNKTFQTLAWAGIVLVLLSCWHLWIAEIPMEFIFHSVEDSQKFWIILDEAFNWLLFANLAYILIATAPEWFKEQFRSLVSRRPSKGYEVNS
jgi:hypothetical protein